VSYIPYICYLQSEHRTLLHTTPRGLSPVGLDIQDFLSLFPPFSLTIACSVQLSLSTRNPTPAAWLEKVRQLWPRFSPLFSRVLFDSRPIDFDSSRSYSTLQSELCTFPFSALTDLRRFSRASLSPSMDIRQRSSGLTPAIPLQSSLHGTFSDRNVPSIRFSRLPITRTRAWTFRLRKIGHTASTLSITLMVIRFSFGSCMLQFSCCDFSLADADAQATRTA